MSSLSYMIFKENTGNEHDAEIIRQEAGSSFDEDESSIGLFSTFRQKSIVRGVAPARMPSFGTVAPKPPRIRDLIEDSGLLKELEHKHNLRSSTEEKVEIPQDINSGEGQIDNEIEETLKQVMSEVLTLDDQEPIGIIEQNPSGVSSGSFSFVSQSSRLSSFDEIPHYCTPQFQPEYLSPAGKQHPRLYFQSYSPPKIEDSQPSRSTPTASQQARGRPPLGPGATKKRTPPPAGATGMAVETSPRVDSSSPVQVPVHISRMESIDSYQTMVSEITLPLEMTMAQLRIDPRAPQYQMALEQQDPQITERTVRSHNHSSGSSAEKLVAPARCKTPPPEEQPSPRPPSQRPQFDDMGVQDPHEITPNFGFPIENQVPHPWIEAVARRGTLGGAGSDQPQLGGAGSNQPKVAQPQGPFSSPGDKPTRAFKMPRTPQQNANPLLFPANLVSPGGDSVSHESIVGPFVSPSVVQRRYRPVPNTPEHDSNPLLFPKGIEYYPPSPAKLFVPPRKLSPVVAPAVEAPSKSPDLTELPLPLTNESVVEGTRASASQTSTSQPSTHTPVVEEQTQPQQNSFLGSIVSVRVKLDPREIVYSVDGEERVHTGLYSGEINGLNQLHGNGVFWFTSGDMYLGQFYKGMLHGVGAISVKSEDGSKKILRGVFHNNEFVSKEDNT